IDKYVSSN
ncbi:unnamed protein product, partial [Rotaria magnacalcarata]